MKNFAYVLDQATASYFVWLACDDWWGTDFLSSLLGELESYPSAQVAMTATSRIFEDGRVKDTVRYSGRDDPNYLSPLALAFRIASGRYYHLFIYGLFRTAFLRRTFPGVPTVQGADRLYILQAALTAPFRYADVVMYFRQVFDLSVAEKYPDEEIGRIYRDPRGHWKAMRAAWPYLLKSPVVPMRRKLAVPILLARMMFWGGRHRLLHFVRGLLDGVIGQQRRQSWVRFIRARLGSRH